MPFKAETLSDARPSACTCAWKDCAAPGKYRAPKDRELRSYLMFCLDHVRAYNAKWDYHKGYTTAELESEIRSAATWDRPTWKMGALGGGRRRFKVHDPFGFAAGTAFDPEAETSRDRPPRDEAERLHAARVGALAVLQLSWPVTLEGLKQRYKALVKKHHPDANAGDPEAESRMKIINQAYQTLKAELAPSA